MLKHTLVGALVGLVVFVIGSSPVSATLVSHLASGADLAGGTVTVDYATIGSVTETIVVGAAFEGTAESVGFFHFSLSDDTMFNDWMLTNLNTDNIIAITFDLTGSNSLFDDDSFPSTPDSLNGINDVIPVFGPCCFTFETDPWTDPMNAGDMYFGTVINFFAGFGQNVTSVWKDDTDTIVPEPTSGALALLGAAGLAAFGKRRR